MRNLAAAVLIFLAPSLSLAAKPPRPPRLGERRELMKLPSNRIPLLSLANRFVRISPAGDRCLYLRRVGQSGETMLYLREFGSPVKEHAALTAVPTAALFWQWGMSGRCWRADGLQAAYLLAGTKDGRESEPVRHRLGVAVFDWSLQPAQQSGGGLGAGAKRTHTSVTFAPTGKGLYRAESDLKEYASCRVVGPRGVLYESKDAAIHHLAVSPDGKHIAWVEVPPHRRRRPAAGGAGGREAAARARLLRRARGAAPAPDPATPAMRVVDLATKKLLRRVELSRYGSAPPVWSADGKWICHGQVVQADRLYRWEIRSLNIVDGESRQLARDALAVGSIGRWLVANRGPGCVPMTQLSSSYAPPPGTDPRPKQDEIILIDPAGKAPPVAIVPDAFAQQVVGRQIVAAQKSGPDVIVWKAPLE